MAINLQFFLKNGSMVTHRAFFLLFILTRTNEIIIKIEQDLENNYLLYILTIFHLKSLKDVLLRGTFQRFTTLNSQRLQWSSILFMF